MTRLSNRQYPMLMALYDQGLHGYLTIEQAQKYDQRPFRSMLIQGWCEYRPGRGFHVTDKGIRALDEFHATDITRHNPNAPLTRYFDPTAYGLAPSGAPLPKPSKKARVHVLEKRRGAA